MGHRRLIGTGVRNIPTKSCDIGLIASRYELREGVIAFFFFASVDIYEYDIESNELSPESIAYSIINLWPVKCAKM